jgi:gliding motility-associated protein GldM
MGLGKTNPKRQMMINMMYLVLTALLALNVSKQVLKAFELVNSGLEKTNDAFTSKNKTTYDQFAKQLNQNKDKVKPWYDKAMDLKLQSDELIQKIEGMKLALITENGKIKEPDAYEHPNLEKGKGGEDFKSASDIEVGTNFFTGPKEKGGAHGDELQGWLTAYKTKVQTLVDPTDKNDVNIAIYDQVPSTFKPEADFHGNPWAHYYFAEVPMVADLTVLTKIQNDIKNTESNISAYLFSKINAEDFKFDKLQAIISSDKPIVLQGQEYSARVVLGAYDSHQNPEVVLNGQKLEVKEGVAEYKVRASGDGEKKIDGDVIVKAPDGSTKKYNFKTAYQVFTGSAVISADKMNVLYCGLENPISVSVPGYPPDKVIVTPTGMLSWVKSDNKGGYTAKPVDNISVREATVNVSVKTDKGVTQMGTKTFRIKRVPKPKVLLGTLEGGPISKVQIGVQSIVVAALENFVFEGLKYTVTKFQFTFVPKGAGRQVASETVNGQIIPANLKALIQSARTGDLVLISDVTATGPIGSVKMGQGPTFVIQ